MWRKPSFSVVTTKRALSDIQAFFAGWAGLGRFWAVTLGLTAALATALQIAGPPHPNPLGPAPIASKPPAPTHAPGRPSVALLVGGIGMSLADSTAAIDTLPQAITLAVAPYGASTTKLLHRIQTKGHEYLLSVPMEPQSFPLDDPDSATALMTSLTETEANARLRAILARVPGAAGLTNTLGPLLGERLMAEPDLFGAVQHTATENGFFFLEAGAQPLSMRGRQADVVLDDDQVTAATLQERLDRLTKIALDKGSAVGIIALPRPVALERVAAWSRGLSAQGVDLVPVSALVSF